MPETNYDNFYEAFKDCYTLKELKLLWEHIKDFDRTLLTLSNYERGRNYT